MIDASLSVRMHRGLLFICLGVSVVSSAKAGVVYDSLAAVPIEDVTGGAVWPGGYFGDAITLTVNSAVLNELKFQANPFFGGSPSSFTAYFYGLDAGADGLFQTGDDKFGSLLGSSTEQLYTFTSSDPQTISITGFSISVPKNFIWVVKNGGYYNDLQVGALRSAGLGAVTGGSSSLTTGVWYNTGAPAPGSSLFFLDTTGAHAYGFDFAVQLNDAGAAVPEIDPRGLGSVLALIMGALGVVERRRRGA